MGTCIAIGTGNQWIKNRNSFKRYNFSDNSKCNIKSNYIKSFRLSYALFVANGLTVFSFCMMLLLYVLDYKSDKEENEYKVNYEKEVINSSNAGIQDSPSFIFSSIVQLQYV